MSAEHLIEQLQSSVEFFQNELGNAKTVEERTKLEKELSEAKSQLQRMQNLNG